MRGGGKEGDPKGWFTSHVRNPEKYPDWRQHRPLPLATNTLAPPLTIVDHAACWSGMAVSGGIRSLPIYLHFLRLYW